MPVFFSVNEFLDPETVDFTHDEVEIIHTCRTVLLAQKDVLIPFSQDLEKRVMRGKIQAKLLPHWFIGGTHKTLLSHATVLFDSDMHRYCRLLASAITIVLS